MSEYAKMYINKSFELHGDDHDAYHHELHEDGIARSFRMSTFFISIPICLAAVLIDLFLIIVILKYKAFKTRGNYYILNFCICSIGFLTSEHILHLAMDLFFGGYLDVNWYCSLIQLENYFLDMCIVFIAGYTIDEYLVMASSEYFLYMYKNGFKFVIAGVYAVHFILAFIVTNVCVSSGKDIRFHTSFIFVTIIYAICLAVIVKIRIDCRKAYFKKNIYLLQALSVTQCVLLFFLPVVFYYNVISIVEKILTDDNLEILRSLAFIAEYLAYASSFVLAYKLFKVNKFYKLAICKVFCSSNSDLDFSRLDVLPEADMDNK